MIVKIFRRCCVYLVNFSYWSKFHVNVITGSGVVTTCVYKGLTRNPEIRNTPVWVFPEIWRLGRVENTIFGTNVSNKKILNTAKYQGYSFYHFWVIKDNKRSVRSPRLSHTHANTGTHTHTHTHTYTHTQIRIPFKGLSLKQIQQIFLECESLTLIISAFAQSCRHFLQCDFTNLRLRVRYSFFQVICYSFSREKRSSTVFRNKVLLLRSKYINLSRNKLQILGYFIRVSSEAAVRKSSTQ